MKTLTFDNAIELKGFLQNTELMPSSFNRPLLDKHIERMEESVRKYGVQRAINLIYTSVFDGTYKYYRADGQHLVETINNIDSSKLRGHFVVFVNEFSSIKEIIPFVSKMNSTAKNWSLDNYLDAWVTQGIDDYIKLKEVKDRTGLGISGLLEAYTDRGAWGNPTFKNGNFTILQKKGDDIVSFYNDCVNIGLRSSSVAFCALTRVLAKNPTVKKETILKRISKQKSFSLKLDRDTYMRLLSIN